MNDLALIRFHRSLYVNLTAAGACLAYGDWPFLPEMRWVVILVGLMLAIAYRVESRWSLSPAAANGLGVVIAIAGVGWVAYQIFRPWPSPIDNLPWPTSLLPYLGPPVLVLMAAKLLRPKDAQDYWQLIGMGLISVALGCALAGDALFGIFLLVYAISLVVVLQLFFRAQVPAVLADDLGTGHTVRHRHFGWTVATVAIAVGGFLLTPRLTDATWEIGRIGGRLQTGISDRDPGIDLNMRGSLYSNHEVAFEVQAETADGQPKLDLMPNMRWRGTTFNTYEGGRWSYRGVPTRIGSGRGIPPHNLGNSPLLPNLGPQQFTLTYLMPTKRGKILFLADPVWPGVQWTTKEGEKIRMASVATVTDYGEHCVWYGRRDGEVFPRSPAAAVRRPRYRQVTAPVPQPDFSLPIELDPVMISVYSTFPNLPQLQRYTNNLISQMIQSGKLNWSGPVGSEMPAELHEEVARSLRSHFASSGAFQYTLELTTKDPSIDPVEDFIINVRKGHCNRFSSALALMLRTQGIPCRVVLGYKGLESKGDGLYAVHNSDAHSWVEVAISNEAADGKLTWRWLSLDPTPELERNEQIDSSRLGRWLDGVQRGTSELFRSFVIDYNSDKQQQTRQLLGSLSPGQLLSKVPLEHVPTVAIILALAIFAGLSALSVSRRRQSENARRARFWRFVESARQRGLISESVSMTPREAVAEFTHSTRRHPDGDELVASAQRLADHYYASRFGIPLPNASANEDYVALMKRIRH